jgi:hypothetical protein
MRGLIPEESPDGGLEVTGEVTGEPSSAAQPQPKDYYDERQDQNKALSLYPHLAAVYNVFYKFPQDNRGKLDRIGFYTGDFAYTPKRVLPWIHFPRLQQEIWNKIDDSPDFVNECIFPGVKTIRHSEKDLISKLPEDTPDLKTYQNTAIQGSVQKAIGFLPNDQALKEKFFVVGHFSLDSFTEGCASIDTMGYTEPIHAIMRVPARYLTLKELIAGLREIDGPNVFNWEHNAWEKHTTRSVLGTLIQMYNQMVNTGVRFGYIYTAVALVFCHIPLDDPSLIQYYLCAPTKDVRIVGGWESNWVRRTALG